MIRQLEERTAARKAGPYFLAMPYAALGERDKAFAALNRSVDQRSGMVVGLKVEPHLQGLRDDPRFAAVLRRLGLPD